jgi:hypothetical protein
VRTNLSQVGSQSAPRAGSVGAPSRGPLCRQPTFACERCPAFNPDISK